MAEILKVYPSLQHHNYPKMAAIVHTSLTSTDDGASVESSFASDAAFLEIEEKLSSEKAALMKKVNGVFCFELSEGPGGVTGVWYIDAKKTGQIYRGKQDGMKADCTIKMKDSDCIKLLTGKLNPQAAFLQGKVKISGNMGLAMKLQQLQSKLMSKL